MKITHSIRACYLCHFIVLNDHFRRTFVLFGIFLLEKSPCLGTQPLWHFFLKNNVFIVCFSLYCVSLVCGKFHSTIFGIYGVFCMKITHSIRVRCLCHFIVLNDHLGETFVLCVIFLLWKSPCLVTQAPWHSFLICNVFIVR